MFVTIILLLVKAENREKSYSKNFSAVSQDVTSIQGVLCMWTECLLHLDFARILFLKTKWLKHSCGPNFRPEKWQFSKVKTKLKTLENAKVCKIFREEVPVSWQAFCVLISFHFVTARKFLMHKNILNICEGQRRKSKSNYQKSLYKLKIYLSRPCPPRFLSGIRDDV